jgi:hypothetical protein
VGSRSQGYHESMSSSTVAKAVVAVAVPAGVAAATVPLREEVDNATTVLVMALVVLGVATLGGRLPAALAAASAALSFDFFHTEPFNSFTIDGGDDVLKTLLLFLVGLTAATLVAHRSAAEASLEERRADLRRVRAVTHAAERSPEALVERLELDLVQLLDLDSAEYQPGADQRTMPRITDSGVVIPPGTPALDPLRPETWTVELPVSVVDRQIGRFVLHPKHPSSGVDMPPGRRDLALTWADQLGFALSRPSGGRSARSRS